MPDDQQHTLCAVCRCARSCDGVISGKALNPLLAKLVKEQHPEWEDGQTICTNCLAELWEAYITRIEEEEQQQARAQKQATYDNVQRIQGKEASLDSSVVEELTRRRTMSERISDAVTAWVGSWSFFGANIVFLIIWMLFNSLALFAWHFDPYPFIFLNLVISWISVLEAPLIMMSQNRQDTRDRLRDEHDHHVNVASEAEVRMLHQKLDQLLLEYWPQLLEIQRMQMELLDRYSRLAPPGEGGSET